MVSHFHLKDIFNVKGLNLIIVGKVMKGEIKINSNLVIQGKRHPVTSIEFQKKKQKILNQGQEGEVFIDKAESQLDALNKLKGQIIYFEN